MVLRNFTGQADPPASRCEALRAGLHPIRFSEPTGQADARRLFSFFTAEIAEDAEFFYF